MRPSQPPRKNIPKPDLDFFLDGNDAAPPPAPMPEHEHPLKLTTNTIFTMRDLGMLAAALISIVGTYFAMKASVASADEKATAALQAGAKVEVVEKRVNRHDTDLAVVERKVDAFEKDLDRRFSEVKTSQAQSEQRILDAVRELKQEVRGRR